MTFIDDGKVCRVLAEASIARYGSAPEHNERWYEYVTEPEQKPVFVKFLDGMALLTHQEGDNWYVFSEPLAPPEKRVAVLIEFLTAVLMGGESKKVVVELNEDTRRGLLKELPPYLRALRINYTLVWPIFDIINFDLSLPGKSFKRLRNIKNKFYKTHKVTKIDAPLVSPEELRAIVGAWGRNRKGRDRSYSRRYYNLIDAHFFGTESARVILVNDRPVAFNAGWPIPRADSQYYAAVGVHDYSMPGLGEIMNLEDIEWIKQAGYQSADFGGGEKALTNFKKQFGPASSYKTFIFSIMRK